ncbi:hypothetical protein [Parasitella parasitica]|uniref:F-box domain-containing protein n=1 Tax=Parasitella parasitica TaxID=35722 RepID=A0A0B7MYL8_9FUNG|nr:hypothetical protein [Parasitella parasitica]
MRESSHPGQLPDRILLCIFEQLSGDVSGWKQNANALYQCQLVNKHWSKFAEKELLNIFTNANLPPKEIANFASAVKATPRLANVVTNVIFYPETPKRNARFPLNADQNLAVILECCPNIEYFVSRTFIEFETLFTWKCLLETKTEHRKLKSFSFSDKWTSAEKADYRSLSLQHQDSLNKLVLFPYHSSRGVTEDTDFCDLKTKLSGFKSLEQLQIRGSLVTSSMVMELDQMLNDCPKTTYLLRLFECAFSSNHTYPTSVVPNYHIKKLEIVHPKLSVCSIIYFERKLKGLEDLALSVWLSECYESKDQCDEWWSHITNLFKPLAHYSFNIEDFSRDTYLKVIECAINMTMTIAKYKSADAPEFIVDFGESSRYIIEIKQNGSRLGLFKSKFTEQFLHNINLTEIAKIFEPYPPKAIKLLNSDHLFSPVDLMPEHTMSSYLIRENSEHLEAKRFKYIRNPRLDYTKGKELREMIDQGLIVLSRPN